MRTLWWKILLALVLVAGAVWLGKYLLTPPPGTLVEDQGREHVTAEQVAAYSYNTNPPTSGPHLPIWVKAGVYDRPLSEGELLHSLEHGYVVISYNCNVHLSKNIKYQRSNIKYTYQKLNIVKQVNAHEEEGEGSPSADLKEPEIATGSAMNETDACKTLMKQLKELVGKKKLWKLIVVPRPQLDTTIALTAWNYIDKFDPDPIGVDPKRIERFIDYHRDHGPEKTKE